MDVLPFLRILEARRDACEGDDESAACELAPTAECAADEGAVSSPHSGGEDGDRSGEGGQCGEGGGITSLLSAFFEAQEARVRVYAEFERGFADVRDSGEFATYASLVGHVTTEFNDLSHRVRVIEGAVRDLGFDDIADVVARVQSLERAKLALTARVQVLKQRLAACIARGCDTSDGELASIEAELGESESLSRDNLCSIVDVLDEIRCAALELREGEE